jgi:hypothetical protein
MELIDKRRNSVKRSRISVSFASRKSAMSAHPDNFTPRLKSQCQRQSWPDPRLIFRDLTYRLAGEMPRHLT